MMNCIGIWRTLDRTCNLFGLRPCWYEGDIAHVSTNTNTKMARGCTPSYGVGRCIDTVALRVILVTLQRGWGDMGTNIKVDMDIKVDMGIEVDLGM